jgi:hypothetical protein
LNLGELSLEQREVRGGFRQVDEGRERRSAEEHERLARGAYSPTGRATDEVAPAIAVEVACGY